jgi:very-short-patch-repair endonuclease
MLTKLAKVDGKTVLLGSNDGCVVSPKRQFLLNNLSDHRKRIPTPAEKKMLWHLNVFCRMLNKNLRYRREMPIHFSSTIGRVVDLAIPSHKILIEIDGPIHTSIITKATDEWKDSMAFDCGWKTLRFTNKQVFEEIGTVMSILATSLLACKRRLSFENQAKLRAIQAELSTGSEWEKMVGDFIKTNK